MGRSVGTLWRLLQSGGLAGCATRWSPPNTTPAYVRALKIFRHTPYVSPLLFNRPQAASAFQGFLGVEDTWYVSLSSCLNNCTWVQCHILVPRVSDCGSLMSYCSCTLIRSFNAMGFHCLLLLLSGWHQLCVGGMCHFTCHEIFAYVHVFSV